MAGLNRLRRAFDEVYDASPTAKAFVEKTFCQSTSASALSSSTAYDSISVGPRFINRGEVTSSSDMARSADEKYLFKDGQGRHSLSPADKAEAVSVERLPRDPRNRTASDEEKLKTSAAVIKDLISTSKGDCQLTHQRDQSPLSDTSTTENPCLELDDESRKCYPSPPLSQGKHVFASKPPVCSARKMQGKRTIRRRNTKQRQDENDRNLQNTISKQGAFENLEPNDDQEESVEVSDEDKNEIQLGHVDDALEGRNTHAKRKTVITEVSDSCSVANKANIPDTSKSSRRRKAANRDTLHNILVEGGVLASHKASAQIEGTPDEITLIEAPQPPKPTPKTSKDRGASLAPIKLKDWNIIVGEDGQVKIEGTRRDKPGILWSTTWITKRIKNKLVATISGTLYEMEGTMNRAEARSAGVSDRTVKRFASGFPVNWREFIQEEYRREPKKGPPVKKDTLSVKKETKKRTVSASLRQKGTEIDPIVVDELPKTRSGRRVKPPVAWWACQRFTVCPVTSEIRYNPPTPTASPSCDLLSASMLHFTEKATPTEMSEEKLAEEENDANLRAQRQMKNKQLHPQGVVRGSNQKGKEIHPEQPNSSKVHRSKRQSRKEVNKRAKDSPPQAVKSIPGMKISRAPRKDHLKCTASRGATKTADTSSEEDVLTVIDTPSLLPVFKCTTAQPAQQQASTTSRTSGTGAFVEEEPNELETDPLCLSFKKAADKPRVHKMIHRRQQKRPNVKDADSSSEDTLNKQRALEKPSRAGISDKKSRLPSPEYDAPSATNENSTRRTHRTHSKRQHRRKDNAASSSNDNDSMQTFTEKHGPGHHPIMKEASVLLRKLPIRSKLKPINDESQSGNKVMLIMETTNKQARGKSTKGMTPKTAMNCDTFTGQKPTLESEDKPWSSSEVTRYHKALNTLNPAMDHFWHNVAAHVGTRSAEQCQTYSQVHEKPPVKRGNKATLKPNNKVRPLGLTGGVGTLKRKRELRQLVEDYNQNHEDDYFMDATPERPVKRIKVPQMDEDDDDFFFQNRPNTDTPLHFKFHTPNPRHPWLPASSETPTTLMSPALPSSVDRRNMEAYVHRIGQEKRSRSSNFGRGLQTSQTPRRPQEKRSDLNVGYQDLFASEPQDSDLHRDSESDEDLYFSD